MKTIFLSRCSDEFREKSEEMYNDFKADMNYEIVEQSCYNKEIPCKTLETLKETISKCDFFIQLIGDQAGAEAGASVDNDDIEEFENDIEELFKQSKSNIRKTLAGSRTIWAEITYTQWEAYLALHLKKTCIFYNLSTEKIRNDRYSSQYNLNVARNSS